MIPDEDSAPKIRIYWNAGRTQWGRRGVDNVLFGASWSNWGHSPERYTHVYLGLWVLTITTPNRGGKTRRDLDPEAKAVMTPWQKVRHAVWQWRANRAFDNRDQYEHGTPEWLAADVRLRKVFGE